MAINYRDPRFQQLLLRSAAKSPWTPQRTAEKETAAWAGEQQKEMLRQGAYGLESKLNEAKIKEMQYKSELAKERLGISKGYLGLEEKGLGLREQGMGVKERGMGIEEQRMGLRSQFQDLFSKESSWRNRQYMRDLADKEANLNLATWLGLGQAAWGGYEGYRRGQLLTEDRKKQAKWDEVFSQLLPQPNGSIP